MRGYVLPLAAACLIASTAWCGEPQVTTSTDKSRLYEGDSVIYRVTVSNIDNGSTPTLANTDDFEVENLGQSTQSFQSFSNINGRITNNSVNNVLHTFRLTPRRTGIVTIPTVVIEADGRKYTGRSINLNVLAAAAQDLAYLTMTTDRQKAYPLTPFTVTLNVFVKALPAPLESIDPVSIGLERKLMIPWAQDERLPKGVEATVNVDRWLGTRIHRDGVGFAINDLSAGNTFSFLPDREATTFEFPHEKVRRPDANGKETLYYHYKVERTFIAKKPGSISFGPATLRGSFATGSDNQASRLRDEPVYALAKRIVVDIEDVPQAGRPDSYTGAIGQFTFRSQLTPTSAKTGDPMTLTLTLSGQGTIDSAGAPDLKKMPAITKDFRVYDATENATSSSRTFTYSVRPLRAGITEFPAVPIAYFDGNKGEYVTIATDPIAVTITEADRLSHSDIVSAPQSTAAPIASKLIANADGLFANITDPAMVRNESVHPKRWATGIASLTLAYLAVVIATQRRRSAAVDESVVRRKGAIGAAQANLKEARDRLHEGDVRNGADKVRTALVGLVAAAANVPEEAMTPRDVRQRLEEWGVIAELREQTVRLLEECDGARYGVLAQPAEEFERQSFAAFDALATDLRAKGRLR